MSNLEFSAFCQALIEARAQPPLVIEMIDGEEAPQVLHEVDLRALGVSYTAGDMPN